MDEWVGCQGSSMNGADTGALIRSDSKRIVPHGVGGDQKPVTGPERSDTVRGEAMKRLRFSLRTALALVALAAIPLWLATTAFRVWQDPDSRTLYVFGQRLDRPTSFSFYGVDAPFWPRYW